MRCRPPFQPDRGNPNISQWSLPDSKGLTARLGQCRINDLALSPDAAYFAAACNEGVWWYDAASMSPIALWTGDTLDSRFVAVSPSGRHVATANFRTIRILDIESGNLNAVLQDATETRWIDAITFSPDGKRLAAIMNNRGGDSGNLHIWDAETGEKIPLLKENITGHWHKPLTFSPDGRLMACSSDSYDRENHCYYQCVTVWNTETGTVAAHLKGAEARNLCFSPCGQYLAAGDRGSVHVWDINSRKLVQSHSDYGERFMHVSYTPEGVLRAAGQPSWNERRSLCVWDVEQGQVVFADEPSAAHTPGYADFLNGTTLAYMTVFEWRIWNNGEEEPRVGQHTHFSCPESLRFLQDGKTLASVLTHDGVLLWDVQSTHSPPRLIRPKDEGYFSLDTAPDGKLILASFSESDRAVRVRTIDSGAKPIEHKGLITEEVDEESLTMAAGIFCHTNMDGDVCLWDVQTGASIRIWEGLYYKPSLSPDGNYMAYRIDGAWNVWDRKSGECKLDSEKKRIVSYNFACSPDGRWMAGYEHSEKAIVLWDIERREARLRIAWPEGWDLSGTDCFYAFSPCGLYLGGSSENVFGTEESAVQIWSVDTGERLAVYAYPGADCLAFSPDGSMLAAASFGGTIRLYDIAHLGDPAP